MYKISFSWVKLFLKYYILTLFYVVSLVYLSKLSNFSVSEIPFQLSEIVFKMLYSNFILCSLPVYLAELSNLTVSEIPLWMAISCITHDCSSIIALAVTEHAHHAPHSYQWLWAVVKPLPNKHLFKCNLPPEVSWHWHLLLFNQGVIEPCAIISQG